MIGLNGTDSETAAASEGHGGLVSMPDQLGV